MGRCKNCGGSGDRFVMAKGEARQIVQFKEIKAYQKDGWTHVREVECGMCHGFGVTER